MSIYDISEYTADYICGNDGMTKSHLYGTTASNGTQQIPNTPCALGVEVEQTQKNENFVFDAETPSLYGIIDDQYGDENEEGSIISKLSVFSKLKDTVKTLTPSKCFEGDVERDDDYRHPLIAHMNRMKRTNSKQPKKEDYDDVYTLAQIQDQMKNGHLTNSRRCFDKHSKQYADDSYQDVYYLIKYMKKKQELKKMEKWRQQEIIERNRLFNNHVQAKQHWNDNSMDNDKNNSQHFGNNNAITTRSRRSDKKQQKVKWGPTNENDKSINNYKTITKKKNSTRLVSEKQVDGNSVLTVTSDRSAIRQLYEA